MIPRACIFRGPTLLCKTLTTFFLFQRDICKQDSGRCGPPPWAPEISQVFLGSPPSCLTPFLCRRRAIHSASSRDAGFCGSLSGVLASAAVDGDIYQAMTRLTQVSAKTCGSRCQTTSQQTHGVGSSDCLHTCAHSHTHSTLFINSYCCCGSSSTAASKYQCSDENANNKVANTCQSCLQKFVCNWQLEITCKSSSHFVPTGH